MLKRYQRAKKLPVLSVSIIDESSPPLVATARAVVDWRDRAGAKSEAGTGFRPLRCWQTQDATHVPGPVATISMPRR